MISSPPSVDESDAVRRFETLVGVPLSEFETGWHADLKKLK